MKSYARVLGFGALLWSASPACAAGVVYDYDTLGRLRSATYDSGKQIVYSYDPAGNRSSVVTQATPPHASAVVPVKHKKSKRQGAR